MADNVKQKVVGGLGNPVGAAIGAVAGEDGGTIWNHQGYDQYQNASLTEQANQFSGTGLDPLGMVAGLWNDITGTTAQSREFAQQEYLQDKMNEYNSPVKQMERMKAAGINPNLAAGGIAGGGNESAQAPTVASNAGGVANGVGQLAGAAGALAGGVGALAGAKETLSLLDVKKANLIEDTALKLSQSGLNKWQSRSIATSLYYMPIEKQTDIYLKLAELDNVRQQYKNMVVEHENILWEIEQKKGEVSLMETQAARNIEDTRWRKLQNEFFEAHHYSPDDPNDVAIRNAIVSGNKHEAEYIGEAVRDFHYNMTEATEEAQLKYIQEKTREEETERFRVKIQEIMANEQVQKELMKFGLGIDAQKSVLAYILQLLFGTGNSVGVGPFHISHGNPMN